MPDFLSSTHNPNKQYDQSNIFKSTILFKTSTKQPSDMQITFKNTKQYTRPKQSIQNNSSDEEIELELYQQQKTQNIKNTKNIEKLRPKKTDFVQKTVQEVQIILQKDRKSETTKQLQQIAELGNIYQNNDVCAKSYPEFHQNIEADFEDDAILEVDAVNEEECFQKTETVQKAINVTQLQNIVKQPSIKEKVQCDQISEINQLFLQAQNFNENWNDSETLQQLHLKENENQQLKIKLNSQEVFYQQQLLQLQQKQNEIALKEEQLKLQQQQHKYLSEENKKLQEQIVNNQSNLGNSIAQAAQTPSPQKPLLNMKNNNMNADVRQSEDYALLDSHTPLPQSQPKISLPGQIPRSATMKLPTNLSASPQSSLVNKGINKMSLINQKGSSVNLPSMMQANQKPFNQSKLGQSYQINE